MKSLILSILLFFTTISLYSQSSKIEELIFQGTQLHEMGKYNDAIAKYQEALLIDSNSTPACYEIAYTYLAMGKYNEAITYSKKVLETNNFLQSEAYIMWGTSLDMMNKPDEAIKVYETGLSKFPNYHLLSYNLALTNFNIKNFDKAETAAINAVNSKPSHASSHILLSAILSAKGQRVKSLLAMYYFLMLEPKSQRSAPTYYDLRRMLGQGVEKNKENGLNINLPPSIMKDKEFSSPEMSLSLIVAANLSGINKNKTELEIFVSTTKAFLESMSRFKENKTGYYWDFYVDKFSELIKTDNIEAFCYYISQSDKSSEVKNWISSNQNKIEQLKSWINK